MNYSLRFAIINKIRSLLSLPKSSGNFGDYVDVVCRILVVFTIFICAYFHGSDLLWKDEGDLLSPKMRANLTKYKAVWKPRTCSLHNYTNKEFATCWSKKESNISVLFLGDSHERALYYMFLAKIQDQKPPINKEISILFHYEKDLNLTIEYEFMPIMNGSFKEKFKSFEDSLMPDLIVIGCNLHPILATNASKINRFQHRKKLASFLPYLDNIARRTTVLWYVQPPVIDEKIKHYRQVIRNRHVDLYNKINLEIVSRTRIKLWTSAREIAIDEMDSYNDDIHVGTSTCEYYVQILSNFWCNEKLYFLDGTCWKDSPSMALGNQWLCFIISIIIVLLLISFIRKIQLFNFCTHRMLDYTLILRADFSFKISKNFSAYLSAVLKFLLTSFYVYICERIPVFPKDQICLSEFTQIAFLLMALVISIYSCSDAQESRYALRNGVINETKGLAVLILLITCIDNSGEFNAYISHFCESAFILMMGIELFYHSWCGKPMKFSHFIQTILKMNLLVTLLCFILGHPYIEYGILPVTLLAYTLSYIVLASPPSSVLTDVQDSELTSNTTILKIIVYLAKISMLVTVFTVLHCSTHIERQILSHPISRSFFATKEDTLAPWLFRWKLDKLSFPLGIVIGFLSELLLYLRDVRKSLKIGKLNITEWVLIAPACLFFTVSTSLGLESFYSMNAGNNDYPFLFVNIAFCYILYRCCLLKMWPIFSKMLATLGRSWLEIYLLHFHIWMAFDGNAFLVLIPFSSILNFCTITVILLFVASDIRKSLNYILP